MKNIIWAVIISLSAAGLAGCVSHSKPGTTATKPDATITGQAPVAKMPAVTNVLAGTNLLADEKARVSYAIGMMFAQNFQKQGVEADPDMLTRGLKDMQSGGTTLLTQQEMKDTLTEYQKTLAGRVAEKKKADGEAFLAKNKTQPGVVTMPDGLQYIVITNGIGAIPTPDDVATVNYRGTLIDGTEFDSSYSRHQPAPIPVGRVIPGWTEALTHMKVGSKWKVFVPSELAYGPAGSPPRIGPNSVLIFEVELLATEHNPAPAPPSRPHPPLTSDIIKVPSAEEMKKGAKPEIINSQDATKLQQPQSPPPH